MENGKATKLIALPGATVSMKESDLMDGGRETVVYDMPVPCYLIEHPKGLVLFDTGCSPRVAVDPVGYWGKVADFLKVRLPPDNVLDRQIKLLGYKLEDVTHVVVSHLHLDHSGGLGLFPKAQFLVMKGELPYAYWPDRHARAAFILNDLLPTRRFDWREFGGDTDIFGDGSLQMLKTPGHTPGEASLFVRLPHRPILLTGDTVHIRAQLDTLAPMSVDWDKSIAVESIKRLRRIRDLGETRIWVSHDPEDWAEMPHSPVAIE
jgi:N-acyl homoserine lactone hydrolase